MPKIIFNMKTTLRKELCELNSFFQVSFEIARDGRGGGGGEGGNREVAMIVSILLYLVFLPLNPL